MMPIRYIPIRGTILCESGVRVGGSRDELEIGGMDNPVVRDARSGEPYLPGSSLKGRMRSLIERDSGLSLGGRNQEEPHGCGRDDCLFCKVFGPHKNTNHRLGPSRLIVRDAYLTEESRKELQGGGPVMDVRTENMVNRRSNTATNPRPVERVARGVTFDLELVVRLFENDQPDEVLTMLRRGLELLAIEGVGDGISRGHGQISISFSEPKEWAAGS
jgi:CRISPR-associated protein Csm3